MPWHDEFILSARIYLPPGIAGDDDLIGPADSVKRFDDGATILAFSPESVDSDDRQESFEAQWQELIERFEHMAGLQTVLAHTGAFVELRLSLTPDEESQAGLVMVDAQLKRWVALGGAIAIDSL